MDQRVGITCEIGTYRSNVHWIANVAIFSKNCFLIVFSIIFPCFFIWDRICYASDCRHRHGLGAVAWPRSMKASFSRATKSWIFLGLESDPLPGGSTGGSTGGSFPGKNWGTIIGMGYFMGHVRDYTGLLGGFFELWEFHMGMKSRIWYLEFSKTAVYARHFMGISMGNIRMPWLAATQNVHSARCAPEQLEIVQPSYTIKQLHLYVQACVYLHIFWFISIYIYTW